MKNMILFTLAALISTSAFAQSMPAVAPFQCEIGSKEIAEDAKHAWDVKSESGVILDREILKNRVLRISGRSTSGVLKVEVISQERGVEVSAFTVLADDGALSMTLSEDVTLFVYCTPQ